MAAPFAGREVAEPPTHVPSGRRIVRSEGNAQKSMTAPENGRPPNVAKGAKPEAVDLRRELLLSAVSSRSGGRD